MEQELSMKRVTHESAIPPRGSPGPEGFTLIELVTTILILLLLGAFIASRLTTVDTVTLASEADMIRGHIRYAQLRAMSSSTIWGINSTGGSYWLFKDGDINTKELLPAESARDDGDGDDYVVTLPSGITMSAGLVAFDSWGVPYTDAAGTTAAVADLTATVTDGTDSRTITVARETGFVP